VDSDIPAVIAAIEAVKGLVSIQYSKATGARIALPFSIRSWDAGRRIVASLVAVGWGKFPLSIIGCVVDTHHDWQPLTAVDAVTSSNPAQHVTQPQDSHSASLVVVSMPLALEESRRPCQS